MNNSKTKQHVRTVILIVLSILILGLLMILFWFLQPSKQVQSIDHQSSNITPTKHDFPKIEVSKEKQTKSITKTQENNKFVTGLENLPRSLQGTDVDGEIIIDSEKNLVVTQGLRQLFDYFLSTKGEESDADILARMEAYIRSRVPQPAQNQTITIMQQYVAYLKELTHIEPAGGKTENNIDINLIVKQKQQIAEIQRTYFDSKTINAFFGLGSAYDEYHIKLFKIKKNTLLTDKQKQLAQEKAIEEIPNEQLKSQLKAQKNYVHLIEQTKTLKENNASAEDIQKLRERMVGKEAADRLALVDIKNTQWQNRVQTYLNQRALILDSDMNETEKSLAIAELKNQEFTDLEQKRLVAYEQLGRSVIP